MATKVAKKLNKLYELCMTWAFMVFPNLSLKVRPWWMARHTPVSLNKYFATLKREGKLPMDPSLVIFWAFHLN